MTPRFRSSTIATLKKAKLFACLSLMFSFQVSSLKFNKSFNLHDLDTYDLGVLELDEPTTTAEKPVELPADREPNRSTRLRPKQEDDATEKSKETLSELHEILTKPDDLIIHDEPKRV
jgi:hypothetical protein